MSQGKDAAPFTIHCIVPFICMHAPAIYDQADLINDAILAIKTICSHCEETFHGRQKRFLSCPNCVGRIHPKCRPSCKIPTPTNDHPLKRQISSPPHNPPRSKKLTTPPQPYTFLDLSPTSLPSPHISLYLSPSPTIVPTPPYQRLYPPPLFVLIYRP